MKDLEKQVQDRVKLPDKTNKSSLSTKKTLYTVTNVVVRLRLMLKQT